MPEPCTLKSIGVPATAMTKFGTVKSAEQIMSRMNVNH